MESSFLETIKDILNYEILGIDGYSIKVYKIVTILLFIIGTKILLWFIKKILVSRNNYQKFDEGTLYAIFQIIKYVIWVIVFGFILESIGVKVTILIAGSTALLVGIGLGLQQTFNDIVSGFILLTERSIKIGDILQIDGDVVKIQDIGLRTSKGLNRDDISIIIPNSLITTSKVINWSHQSKKTRFKIDVGVAYGSDVDLVTTLLIESALAHPDNLDKKLIDARLSNFGSSALEFQLLFFSNNIFRIEKVKSEIRKIINKKFNENNIVISFPQLDVHIKSDKY
ncbi:mechanosensitive ion channel family protein [Mariniflexile aquimaris]|uniref:Mechanosensitive ion channel family protein n=1 Tax=Mariniflexile aquimaris TaxID=881009 RepID=A0ABW3BUE0_9FLAO